MSGRAIRRLAGVTAAMLALCAALAPAALATPMQDYDAVKADWGANNPHVITHCKFTPAQLDNARNVSASVPEDSYNGFPEAIDNESAYQRNGGCAVAPGGGAGGGSGGGGAGGGSGGGGSVGGAGGTRGTGAGDVLIPRGTQLRLTVDAHSVRLGARRQFLFTVTAMVRGVRVVVKGATVRFGGVTRTTDRHGNARVTIRFGTAGLQRATVSAPGLRGASLRIRVRPPARRR